MSDAPLSRPCPDCASPVRAADQSFCDSCGAFLRWDSPAGAASAEVPSAAPPSAPSAPASSASSESGGTVREEPGPTPSDDAPRAAAEGS
ncbi:hypothetical protein AB0O51_37260, partial [Streptomyces sp. NPDC090301]